MMKYSFENHHLHPCDRNATDYLVTIESKQHHINTEKAIDRMVHVKKEMDHIQIFVMIPSDTMEQPATVIMFLIKDHHLIIHDDQGHALAWLDHIVDDHYFMVQPSPLDLVLLILEVSMSHDVLFFSMIQQHFEQMEESLFDKGGSTNVDHRLSHYKRIVHRFSHYYLQLTDFLYTLSTNDSFVDAPIDTQLIHRLIDRLTLLRNETQLLNDYGHQVQGTHHNMIEQHQNEIMKVLTIVTTVFLPLSLLASWYGMNFSNMPELSWPLGYPMVIIIGITMTIMILVIFRKHRLL